MTGVPTRPGSVVMDGRTLSRTDLVVTGVIVIGACGIHYGSHHRDDQQSLSELEPATPVPENLLTLRGVTQALFDRHRRDRGTRTRRPHHRRGRVRLPDRRVRLRQVDPAAHHRRLRANDGRSQGARQGDHGAWQRPGHGFPGLCAVPMDDRSAEYRLWPATTRLVAGRDEFDRGSNSPRLSGSSGSPTAIPISFRAA